MIEVINQDKNSRSEQHSRFILLLIILLVSFSMINCSDNGTGNDISNNGNNNNNNNNNDEIGAEPTFSNVQLIFEQSCGGVGCHIGNRESGVQLDGYENVINSTGSQYDTEVVEPGNADSSPLVDKIESDPTFGDRMPQDGPPYLPTERINQIKEWIDQGAENN